MERIDKPDYAERAVLEAIVNALIHRDWLVQGAEVHINIYDDRCEISSPGGMYSGKIIQEQDIYELESERRNPVLADLFHRMKYMDRRGSGLKKIVNETQKLHGYEDKFEPEFYSTTSSFKVRLKNVNYKGDKADVGLSVGINDGINVGLIVGINETQKKIIAVMIENPSATAEQISQVVGITKRRVESNISKLKKDGYVERIGARRAGHWIVKSDQ